MLVNQAHKDCRLREKAEFGHKQGNYETAYLPHIAVLSEETTGSKETRLCCICNRGYRDFDLAEFQLAFVIVQDSGIAITKLRDLNLGHDWV